MPSPKEKPKGTKTKKSAGKTTARSQPAISAKQAAKLMRDKYAQQLDQRRSESGSVEVQAAEQVERAGAWAVDELILHEPPRFPHQGIVSPSGSSAGQPEEPTVSTTPDVLSQEGEVVPRQKPEAKALPREKMTQIRSAHQAHQALPVEGASTANSGTVIPHERAVQVKERTAIKIKEKKEALHSIRQRSVSPSKSITSIESIRQPGQRAISPTERPVTRSAIPSQRALSRHTSAIRQPVSKPPNSVPASSRSTLPTLPLVQGKTEHPIRITRYLGGIPSERKKGITRQSVQDTVNLGTSAVKRLHKPQGNVKGVIPKARGTFYPKGILCPKSSQPLGKSAIPGTTGARRAVQRQIRQRTIQRAKNAVKAPAVVLKKAVAVTTRTAAALISSVAALAGGGILLLALVMIVIVAAVANSPFGLFFAQEPNATGTLSVAQAVGAVNMAYNERLELLQTGGYDDIIVHGQSPDWVEVLAVFAVKTAGADVDGLDVATLDTDRLDKLTAVFWDMTEISISEETVDHPASGSTEAWTETILHIMISPKTTDEMKINYAFSPYQNSALDELLSDRAALTALAGDLSITGADIRDILADLPADLIEARQNTVRTALQLVGKVNYFWGGKSRVIGWDERWGQTKKVTASGSSTSGTYRPFGLDCSGFVDWTFNNSLGYIIGHGGGARAQHSYCTDISQGEAQPGDLAFYPDDSHVGIIVGRDEAGKLLVCHCSSGRNNVVVTEFSASGFTVVGRPDIFMP